MSIKEANRIIFLLLTLSFILNSCVIDTKPLGYRVKNCTNDTLLLELTESDTLDNWIYWGNHSEDTIDIGPEDTTVVYIHGDKVIFSNYYYTLPDSTSGSINPLDLDKDTCYIYSINWQVAIQYSLEEIRAKRLYDRRTVTKRDFNHNRIFEYKAADSSKKYIRLR